MKIQKAFRFIFLISVVLVAGCTQSTKSVGTSSPMVITKPVSSTVQKETMTPNSAPLTTSTPIPSFTPMSIPTLPPEDAHKKLWNLLANNGDCILPCLWGITPRKSTYLQAQSILSPISSISGMRGISNIKPRFDLTGGFVEPYYAEGKDDLIFNATVSYLSDNQIVNHIHFRAQEEQIPTNSNGSWISRRPIYGLPIFIERVEYYSLSHLLNEQGIPDSVMIQSSGPSVHRTGSILIHTAVLYPNRGIWAEYTTLVNEDEVGSITKSCPINAHVEMELYPVGNPDSFYTLLDQTDWGITKNAYKPLKEATSMSLKQFYESFRQPTNKCIETPTKIWPTPEW